MTRPMPGGRRRVDVVLAPEFVADLDTLDLPELRARRHEAEQEEADLSFLRRMLHGRIAIVEAEIARRAGKEGSVVDDLVDILSDDNRSTRGSGRHLSVEPSRVDEHRRDVEQVVSDATISDVEARSDDELAEALARLKAHEAEVSEVRRDVQAVMDALTTQVGARYRDGSASVDDLLIPGTGG
jgi:hypothetical protein